MSPSELYACLTRARRDLWATLQDTPDDVLRRPLLHGERFHSILDLVRHTAQIAALLRTQGVTPPQLDLLYHLPCEETGRSAAGFVNRRPGARAAS